MEWRLTTTLRIINGFGTCRYTSIYKATNTSSATHDLKKLVEIECVLRIGRGEYTITEKGKRVVELADEIEGLLKRDSD